MRDSDYELFDQYDYDALTAEGETVIIDDEWIELYLDGEVQLPKQRQEAEDERK